MNHQRPSLLIKFGTQQNLRSLVTDGIIHCKSIKWFAEYEDGKLRGDEFEAVIKTRYSENVIVQIREADNPNSEWRRLNTETMLYKEFYKEPLGNLFCLSQFSVNEGIFELDKRFSEFGGHLLFIHNQIEFFKRVDIALNSLGIGHCRGKIEYINLHKHTGQKMLFQKDNGFSYQEEYRIHIHRDHSDSFEFSIGSIEDIAVVFSFADVQSFIIRKREKQMECAPILKSNS